MFLDSKKPSILVLGDIMLDYSTTGAIEKLANEAPIPVLVKKEETVSLGGCGNVVQNLHALGCKKLYLLSVCGDDNKAIQIQKMLDEKHVLYKLWKVAKNTTSKHRFFANSKLLFRYDEEERVNITTSIEYDVLNAVSHILEKDVVDCIYFSDYNKGFLTKNICQGVIQMAREKRIFVCVDPKNDYTKYKGCSLIKPNRNEVEHLYGMRLEMNNLESALDIIRKKTECSSVVITLGNDGISYSSEKDGFYRWKLNSKEIIDVTGAGDIVGTILAYYYPQKDHKKSVIELSSYMGTVSVSHLGTYILKLSDIIEAERSLKKNKYITVDKLQYIQGRKIFTNGCFDILHEGHLGLLSYCRSLAGSDGHVIVAINNDSSIRSLKGGKRPIRDERQRIAMLNAIDSVDWIVIFSESTPVEILKIIQPDVLVKGGDYTKETVLGKEYCKEVQIFPFEENISTTKIIEKITQSTQS